MDLKASLAELPESVSSQVQATLAPTPPEVVTGFFVEQTPDAVSVFLVAPAALLRVQVLRAGPWQRSLIPLSSITRVEELFDGQQLTVVVEFTADRTEIALAGSTFDNRIELQGASLKNGYVLAATAPFDELTVFAAALRSAIAG